MVDTNKQKQFRHLLPPVLNFTKSKQLGSEVVCMFDKLKHVSEGQKINSFIFKWSHGLLVSSSGIERIVVLLNFNLIVDQMKRSGYGFGKTTFVNEAFEGSSTASGYSFVFNYMF